MSVSVKDVAVAASVSVGTVSNVLNRPERVSPETVERVRRVIAELGFVRNDAARQLRAGRSRTIGLVVPDISNPFFADVARGAEARASEAGLAVLVGSSGQDALREESYLGLFREQRANGVLLSPAGAPDERLLRLREAGLAVVMVDHEVPDLPFSSVAVDDVGGGALAVTHLIERGRRRIAFVSGPLTIRQVADRLVGARQAIAAHRGVALEVIEVEGMTVLHGRDAGETIRARAAADRPDAVFAANDLLAVGALQAMALMSDIRIPDEIALIGYDDIDFAAAAIVPLTSIRQPAQLMGATAVDLLLRGVDADPSTVRFAPELVVRGSTG